MNKRGIYSYILLLTIIIYTLVYRFIIYTNILKYAEVFTAAFFIILFLISKYFFGFQKNKQTRIKKEIIITTIISLIIYFSSIYALGLILGFLKNAYSLKFTTMLNNVFFVLFTSISIEMIRYNFVTANKDNKMRIIIFSIIISIFEIVYCINSYSFKTLFLIFKFTTTKVLPIIAKNLLLTYYSLNSGYIPSLIYRIVMDIYIFFVPIVPNLGDYLTSSFELLFPFILYVITYRIIQNKPNDEMKNEEIKETKKIGIVDISLLCMFLLFAYLISGIGTYHLIGVGSNSMYPYILKGDAVIIKKISADKINEGDIIAFKKDGLVIIHRVVDIKITNDKKTFLTKGDANNTNDEEYIGIDRIEGIIINKIPYIAYPTIFFYEIIKK